MNKSPTLNVLLVEDDRDLAASVSDYLALETIICDHAYNGRAGLDFAIQNKYDAVLLDINLPRLDGLGVCEQMRRAGVDTPVLMLTARDTLADKIAGFRAGTDDYLVKPFAMEELVVRIQALAARRSGQVRRLRVADIDMDLVERRVVRQGLELKLTPSGWILLETLMRASPSVVSRSELEYALWKDSPPDTNSLKVHLYNLRKQVNKPFRTPIIHTVSSQGFVLREYGN